MIVRGRWVAWIVVGGLVAAGPAAAGQRGRVWEEGHRFRLGFTVGEVDPIEGEVVETDRPLNELRDPTQRDNAESFTFEEFGLESSNTTWGVSLEVPWKWVSLFVDLTNMRAEAEGNAPRDLFIGVDDVRFDGQSFDYQVVLEGSPYVADLDAWILNLRGAFTPYTFNPGGRAQLVPWISFGVFGFGGGIDVDAGPALGTQIYENPPRLYVENGSSKGDGAAFGPEIGVGGELKINLGQPWGRRADLVLQGNYNWFDISATTGDLGISSRNEKAVEYDYTAADGRILFEWPMTAGSKFLIGAEWKRIEITALVEALERPVEEVLELREKFNKRIDMELTSANLTVGFRW